MARIRNQKQGSPAKPSHQKKPATKPKPVEDPSDEENLVTEAHETNDVSACCLNSSRWSFFVLRLVQIASSRYGCLGVFERPACWSFEEKTRWKGEGGSCTPAYREIEEVLRQGCECPEEGLEGDREGHQSPTLEIYPTQILHEIHLSPNLAMVFHYPSASRYHQPPRAHPITNIFASFKGDIITRHRLSELYRFWGFHGFCFRQPVFAESLAVWNVIRSAERHDAVGPRKPRS